MDQVCKLGMVFFLLLSSLTLMLLALLTDNWYHVHTGDSVDPGAQRHYNFHFGLWRLCYDNMPSDIASDESYDKEGSSCIFIHKDLIQRNEEDLDEDSQLRLHLSRTVLGCSIASTACTLFALLALICGVWPSARRSSNRWPCVYLSTALLLLLAAMNGIASGVSFIAVRDLDNTVVRHLEVMPPVVPPYASQAYDWSFMSHWVATGLIFFDSLFLICMLRTTYQVVEEGTKMHAMDSF